MDFAIPTGEPGILTDDSGKLHAQRQAEALATSLKQTWVDLKEAIQTSQAQVSSRENLKRRDPTLAAGDLAYLDTRHLSRGRLTPKLDYRWTGPYRAEAIHGGSAKFSLPTGSRIHPTVDLSYLRRFDHDPLPGQTTDAESPDPVIAGKDPSEDEFEVTRILDAFNEFFTLPSTKVRRPCSPEVTPPSPPTGKPQDESFFPRGGGVTGRRPSTCSLQALIPCPRTSYPTFPSCTHTFVHLQVA